MASAILEVKDLQKSYGDKKAVDGINFSVEKGETFGILGPNGAGKTTTLEMIETLRPIDGGSVILNGLNVANQPQKVRYIIGVQTQSTAFMDKVKLTELLEQQAAAYGAKVDAIGLLNQVNLAAQASSYIEQLSGGQQQRLSIAAALVHQPKVFFLDEPTTGLDPQARHRLWDLIAKFKKQGMTVILTTHYMEEAETLCDRVAIMDEGKIVALDTPKNLVNQLLDRGFKKQKVVQQADLEDVFLDLTGKELGR